MIPKEYVEDLLSRADIVEIIGRDVVLTKSGSNYFGYCPFHGTGQEEHATRNSGFTVSRTKNFYHCFGCGEHGNIIGFLIKHRGVSFPIAVQVLADIIGAEPPPCEHRKATENAKKDEVYDTLRVALDYYRRQLRNSAPAITLLKGAGISGTTAALFQVGFAPDGWQNLEPVFKEQYRSRCTLAGLATTKEDSGKVYDRFRNRVIFPTMDARGRVLGLAGLALKADVVEYIRTTRSNKEKSSTKKKEVPTGLDAMDRNASMFGLNQANISMHAKQFVVLVQDCMDVLRLHEGGIHNVVSPADAGTLKPEHVERLFRRTPCVICCFPSTKRGAQSAWKTMKAVLPALSDDVQVRFLVLPDQQSPGDLLQQQDGRELFNLLLSSAIPLSEFLLRGLVSQHNTSDIEGRAKLLGAAGALLETLRAPNTKALLEEAVAELINDRIELLDSVEEHDEWLKNVIDRASTEVLIVSPWITNAGINRFDLCERIAAAVARGVNVTIFTDIEFSRERRCRTTAGDWPPDGAEAALAGAGARLHFVNRIHSKIVVVDDAVLCIGSFNWLSAARTGPYQRHEVSTVHRQGHIATRKEKLLSLMLARTGNNEQV